MDKIMNNVEVMENEEVKNEIVPVAEVFDDEPSETDMSKRDMVIGLATVGLATAGAIALGRCAFKGCKAVIKKINAVIKKIKDRSAKKDVVIVPATEEINEQPIVCDLDTEEDEVIIETR